MADLRNLMASTRDQQQLRTHAMMQLWKLLTIEHLEGAKGQKAVDIGLVPVLVEQLSGCDEVQKIAALFLSGLAIHHAEAVVDAGAVLPLVQLVSSPDDDVRTAAIAALRSITVGSVARRDAVVAAGVLEPLLKAMRESSNSQVLAIGACLLSDLLDVSANSPLPAPLAEFAPFVPILVGLICTTKQDELVPQPTRAALRLFARSCVGEDGTDAGRDALVECGAMASIKTLIETAEVGAQGIAGLLLRFTTAGTTAHRQAVIDADLVPLLVDVASNGETHGNLKRVAGQAVANIALGGSQQQVEYVVECGGIQPICDLIDIHDYSRVITIMSLDKILCAGEQKQANEGLPNNPYHTLLEQAGGVDKIVDLQAHNDVQIAMRAIQFLFDHSRDRVDAQRAVGLEVQAAEVETNVGADDDIGSDGEGKGDIVDGQLEGESGEEGAER
ncbi:unnamed protein product [Vitrella brassicaformis CCMP3155]|uniref:Importin subunit alpha n=2 Tax=Vitrella brassicaformis TaxID=1169539 RepID=A0A0G4FK84_VITBC|nr:unnamed protein product [Vitrella brassicaformis CCMP3155]|eukprot:CEM14190.1 unnamed protein product [Vitrella brassicaformis CCMP3155]